MNFVLNFSQSTTKINLLRTLDQVNNHSVPSLDEIHHKIHELRDSVENNKGITNVKSRFDDRNYIFEFSFDFDRIERVNQVAYQLWKEKDAEKAVNDTYYSFQNQTFKIDIGTRISTLFKQMNTSDREILIGANYLAIVRFEKEIINQTNKSAIIPASKKVVVINSPVLTLIHEPYQFNNTITLQP